MPPHTPNLNALLGESIAASLLALEGGKVTPLFLLTCSSGKLFHLGKTSSFSSEDSASSSSSTPQTWIFTQVPSIKDEENAKIRTKAANILAEAIKKCAAADHGGSSKDGSVGKENREKFEKRVELLKPKVEYIAEEDKQLAVPVDIFDRSQDNKNAKHRAGTRLQKDKKLEKIERAMTAILSRCVSDEEKTQKMRTREFQSLVAEKEELSKTGEQKVQERQAGNRRDRDGNVVVNVNSSLQQPQAPAGVSGAGAGGDDYDDL